MLILENIICLYPFFSSGYGLGGCINILLLMAIISFGVCATLHQFSNLHGAFQSLQLSFLDGQLLILLDFGS
jgi:hypothetical protein